MSAKVIQFPKRPAAKVVAAYPDVKLGIRCMVLGGRFVVIQNGKHTSRQIALTRAEVLELREAIDVALQVIE